jgi:hypothetical protein
MELLDRGHLAAFLRHLEAIGQHDPGAADLERREVTLAEAHPQGREPLQRKGLAVEEVQQA